MTLLTQSTKSVALTNGATVTWPYTFLIAALEDVVLTIVNNTSGVETVIAPVNFSITGLGDPLGGIVTYPTSGSPLAAGSTVVVERFVADVQETDLINQGGVYPQDIEDALDYLTMITQQQQDQIDRSIVFSVADTVEQTLPIASARANMVLGFDSSGNPTAVSEINPSVTVSAAMIPVVTAATTAAALAALGIPGNLADVLIPSGTCWEYNAGGAAPSGFVFPIGQACTALYPDYRAKLVAAGSPYGTNGVDPLMPDRRSTVAAGKSNMGGVDNGLLTGGTVLGAVLGVQSKTLLTANLPAYTPAGTIVTSTSSVENVQVNANVNLTSLGNGGAATGFGWIGLPTVKNMSTILNGTFTSTFTGTAQGGTATAFSIVQPTFICNFILKVH